MQERLKFVCDFDVVRKQWIRGGLCVLKIAQKDGIVRFGKKEKLEPRFSGILEIVKRFGKVACQLALSPQLALVYELLLIFFMLR